MTHSAIALATTIARSDDLVFAELGDETVLMSLEQSEYYGLDAIGTRIWALLDQPMTVADLCHRLVQLYAVELEICQQDTLDFLQELYDAKIITVVDTPAA
jgi:hypothetical protein